VTDFDENLERLLAAHERSVDVESVLRAIRRRRERSRWRRTPRRFIDMIVGKAGRRRSDRSR
jgi:hypothetical protein